MVNGFSGLTLALLVTGCAARALDVGSNAANGGSTGSPTGSVGTGTSVKCPEDYSPALPEWPSNDDCAKGTQEPLFLGRWDGYVQGASIDDQFNTFVLEITAANETRVCGSLRFGDQTAPVTLPAVTGPDEPYPPGSISAPPYSSVKGPFLGVAYTLQDGHRSGQRMTFKFALSEVFREWCSVQSSYEYTYDTPPCTSYHCVPGGYMFQPTGPDCKTQSTPNGPINHVSCAKVDLCGVMNPYCVCNASQCVADASTADASLFDLTVSGETATGVYGSNSVVFHRVYTRDN